MMSLLSLMFYCFVVSMSLLFHRLLQFSHSGMNHIVGSTSVGHVLLNHSAITDGFLEFLAGVVIRPTGTAKQTGEFPEVFHLGKVAGRIVLMARFRMAVVPSSSSWVTFFLPFATNSCA